MRSGMTLALTALVLAAAAGLTWANLRFVESNPGGNDFIPRWVGTRAVLTERASPYSEAVTVEVQQRLYGRPARPGEDAQLFVYPYYSILLFAPFALIPDFDTARAAWMTFLELSLGGLALLSLALTGWRPRLPVLAGFFLFSLLWYHSVRPLVHANPAIPVALFIALALFCIQRGRDGLAGLFLALATIKPQMVILLLACIAVWVFSRRRVRILTGFAVTLGILAGGSFLLERGWFTGMLSQMALYPAYTQPGTPAGIFGQWWGHAGARFGWGLALASGALLLVEWLAARNKGFDGFLWTACLTLAAGNFIGIPTASANYIVLLPGLALLFALWQERWPRSAGWLQAGAMLELGIGLWWWFLATVDVTGIPLEHLSLHFPLPLFVIAGLYWMRWWALRPHRKLPLEGLRARS
ncbi:MAG: DUF2029 domain-containing protein [Chloroflexi bacterium]|nr:DUF2029 domain-containing protein [Chloroflexota bacterium]